MVCDLPAAWKIGGFPSHNHHYFCSICWCNRKIHSYDDFNVESWIRRQDKECHYHAEQWKTAPSNSAAQSFFDKSGVRWLELLRLPYYEPSHFLVIDPMHNLFLGLVKEHFQGIFGYDPSPTGQRERSLQLEIMPSLDNPEPTEPREKSSLCKLQAWIEAPLEFERTDLDTAKRIVKWWSGAHLASLLYIAKGVGCISMTIDAKGKDASLPHPTKPLTRVHVAE